VFFEIYALRAGFVVVDGGARASADGFFGEAEVEEAAGCAGEEGRVLDCAEGGDDVDGVFGGGEVLGEGEAGPAGADGWLGHRFCLFDFRCRVSEEVQIVSWSERRKVRNNVSYDLGRIESTGRRHVGMHRCHHDLRV